MAASAQSLGGSQLSSGIQCSSTDDVVRGYKEQFSPPLKAELLCLLCNLGLRDPMKDIHNHVFCLNCFRESVSKNGPICPIYRSSMSTTETHLNTCKFVVIRRGSWEQQYKHNGAQKSASKNDHLAELEQKVFQLEKQLSTAIINAQLTDQQNQQTIAVLRDRVGQLEEQLSTAIINAQLTDQQNQQTIAVLRDRVGQLEEQLSTAIINAQLTDQRNQQTITNLMERVSQLVQQLRIAMTDLTNRVRQLEEKGEEEELASHMKNLSI